MSKGFARPAVALRPLLESSESQQVVGYFGGLPEMPPDMPWPRKEGVPLFFLGQLDLGLMPRSLEIDALGAFDLPACPASGTLYFFWDVPLQGLEVRALHAPADVGPLLERPVPEDMPDLLEDEFEFLDKNGLDPDHRQMRKMRVEALPFMSHRNEADVDKEHGHQGAVLSDDDFETAMQCASVAALLGGPQYPQVDYSFPWLTDPDRTQGTQPEKLLGRLLSRIRGPKAPEIGPIYGLDEATGAFVVPETFPWVWSVVAEIAGEIRKQATLDEKHLYDFWNGDAPELLHLWKEAPAEAEAWISKAARGDRPLTEEEAEAFRAWLNRLSNAALHIDISDAPDPVRVAACKPMLEVLETERHVMQTWPDLGKSPACLAAEKLVPMMGCIEEFIPAAETLEPDDEFEGVYWTDDKCPVPYYEKWRALKTPRETLQRILAQAMENLSIRYWRYGDEAALPRDLGTVADWNVLRETTVPRGEINDRYDSGKRIPLQIFGFGEPRHNTEMTQADKILLFQLPGAWGLPIQMDFRFIQVWISPEDLAKGHFDRSFTTG